MTQTGLRSTLLFRDHLGTVPSVHQGGHLPKLTLLFQEAALHFPFRSASEFPGISSHGNKKKVIINDFHVFHYSVIDERFS